MSNNLFIFFSKLKGGSGSGNFGHVGREGYQGGSIALSGYGLRGHGNIKSHDKIGDGSLPKGQYQVVETLIPKNDIKKALNHYGEGYQSATVLGGYAVVRKVDGETSIPKTNEVSSISQKKPQEKVVNPSPNKITNATSPSHSELSEHYNLKENCQQIDCGGLRKYTIGGYRNQNERLRTGKNFKNNAKIDETIGRIDKALDQLPRTKKDMKVVRMVDDPFIIRQMVKGSEFTDKGFVSTSIKSSGLKHFGNVKINILVPKGSKGAYLEDITTANGEQEFLLPRNSKFKVLQNDYQKSVTLMYMGDTP